MTYFFHRKFNLPEGELGTIFFVTSSIAAASMLVASSIAKRIGNIKVRISHLVCNQYQLIPLDDGLHPSALCHLPIPHFGSLEPPAGADLSRSARMFTEHGCRASLGFSSCRSAL